MSAIAALPAAAAAGSAIIVGVPQVRAPRSTTPPRPVLSDLGPAAQLRAGRLPRRLVQLMVGLTLFGASMALTIQSGLGMLPWDVFHYGAARHLPLSLGATVIVTGVAVLLAWIPLRQKPGLGTVANAIWVGVVVDPVLRILPEATGLPLQVGYLVTGVVLNGLATAMYIGSQLGPGPRDGLMTGLSRVTGRSLRIVRTVIEVTVVAAGWTLGGVVGVGTVLYALAIGPLTQAFLPHVTVALDASGAASAPSLRVIGARRRAGSRARGAPGTVRPPPRR